MKYYFIHQKYLSFVFKSIFYIHHFSIVIEQQQTKKNIKSAYQHMLKKIFINLVYNYLY